MRISLLGLLIAVPLAGPGCKSVDCGDGTLEADGTCVPASAAFSNAKCGKFTTLVGDTCTPSQAPTLCGPGTVREVDPQTGLGTCNPGGAGGGCGAPISCPNPTAAGKQTICGQLFDFETSERFEAAGATGARCTTGATSGPCALAIRAFDAIQFATNPQAATPLAVGDNYVDDCGRYRLTDITPPPASSPFVGLGIDDANQAMAGPLGVTNTVGLATLRAPDTATKELEAFVAPKPTTDAWTASGGPPISGGYYAMVFRARSKGAALNPGVAATKMGAILPAASAHYMGGCSSLRTSVDGAATVTGGTGTVLVTGASIADGGGYSGSGGGLPAECRYPPLTGIALPFILFVQVARPINVTGMTCPL